jgi:cyanophycinase
MLLPPIQIKLAEIDDPATYVDEAAWAGNAGDAGEIAKIQAASAIWFTGGDQARTMRLLTRNWEDTPMLAEIRKRLASGAVVGGTSAGAAIMGSGMIICGDPRRANDAISRDPADCATLEGETEPLVVGNGLGFLTNGIVDQHFSQRARLPRLVRAVTYLSGTGIGIDEDTALFVDLRSSRALVMGKGFVTTVRVNGNSNYAAGTMRNARLDQYRAGESFVVGK